MTIAVAWVRSLPELQELVLVTDSRLSGDGRNFDACVKTMTLPRGDVAIAFAGYSGHAYPMMQQLANAISSHVPLANREIDIGKVKSHAIKIFDGMRDSIRSSDRVSSPQDTDPEAEFILAGYSWKSKSFRLWKITFDKKRQAFAAHPPQIIQRKRGNEGHVFVSKSSAGKSTTINGDIIVAGDQSRVFQALLVDKLNHNAKHSLNMEPFEVVRDMLRDSRKSETIGGAPQIVKVFQHMSAVAMGVYWPDKKNGKIYLQGRACLPYERIDTWQIDPDTFEYSSQNFKSTLRG